MPPGAWKTLLRPVTSSELAVDEEFVAAREDRQLRRRGLAFDRQCRRAHEVLAAYPDGLTARRLREMLGVSGERMSRLLERLLEQGLVKREAANQERGRTIWTYFWVPSPADFSLSAVKTGSLAARDAKAYDRGTGQFVDGKKQANSSESVIPNSAESDRAAEQAAGGMPTGFGGHVGLEPTHAHTEPWACHPSAPAVEAAPDVGRDTNIDGKNMQNSTPAGDAGSQLPEADGGAPAMS